MMYTFEERDAHYDKIMSPGLSYEAIAEGFVALNLINTPGFMLEGSHKLTEWYKKYYFSKRE